MTVLVALDVDGVLNGFSKNPALDGYAEIHDPANSRDLPIKWRKNLLERMRMILSRPDVTGAWLTTWLMAPAMLDELEHVLGLEGLLELRAPYLTVEMGWGKVPNPLLPANVNSNTHSPNWWKFHAWEALLDLNNFQRGAWLDDDLGRAKGGPGNKYTPGESFDRLLLRTNPQAGMLSGDLDKLESWLDRTE